MATNPLEGKPLVAEALRGTVCVGVAFDTDWKGKGADCTRTANGGAQCYVYLRGLHYPLVYHYGSGFFFHDSRGSRGHEPRPAYTA